MYKKLIIAILIIGLALRIIGLQRWPAGFTPDEASFGYDAYSILQTGKDQWGNTLPLNLKSFGDYKMPLYAYITIPSVAIFGLNEFATRLPNALIGTAAIYITFLLTQQLLKQTNIKKQKEIALLSAFLLAISPWHIPMSRGAFEANLTTFFLPLGIYFFLKALDNTKYLYFSAIIFGLNLFTYHSARLITPLIVFMLVLLYFKDLIKINRAVLYKSAAIFILFLLIAVYSYSTGAGSRVATVGIFSQALDAGNQQYSAVQVGVPSIIAKLFNNKFYKFFELFLLNYTQYLSPRFFFIQGAGEATYGMTPSTGVLYLIEAVFLTGFLYWIFSTKYSKIKLIIIGWFLLAPIPAALAIGPGYAANRAVIMLPVVQIMLAIGAVYLIKEKIFIYVIAFLLIFNFIFWTEDYFIQQPARFADSMIYGNQEIYKYLENIENNYNEIIISKTISEPHIYTAFYRKVPPLLYHQNAQNWNFEQNDLNWVDQLGKYQLGKYTYRTINWEHDKNLQNTLLIGNTDELHSEVPENLILKKVYLPNNQLKYKIVDPQNKAFAKQ